MSRNLQSKQKSDTSVRITIIVAIIGLVGTLGGAYLNSRATIETKKQEIAIASTQLAVQVNSTTNAAFTLAAIPTNTPNPTATTASTQEVIPNASSEIFIEDFSKGSQYWELGTLNNDSLTSSLSIFNNVLRWQVIAKKDHMAFMGSALPITSNIDIEATLNFVDGSEVEYGLVFRNTDSGAYRFLISRETGKFLLSKHNKEGNKVTYLIHWTTSIIPINLNSGNKLRVQAIGDNIRLYINDKLVGDVSDNSFSSGAVDIIGNFYEGDKLTLDITDFRLTLISP